LDQRDAPAGRVDRLRARHDDTGSGRALVEAFVAIRTPFAESRGFFLGKAPGTLEEIVGRGFDVDEVASTVIDAYAAAYGRELQGAAPEEVPSIDIKGAPLGEPSPREDPPWTATVPEAIGEIGAGSDRSGRLRVGGDLLVSRDAIDTLEQSLATLPPSASAAAIGAMVDRALAAPGVALDGVKSLKSIGDVIARARELEHTKG
jgi:hypothetical protein